MNVLETRIDLDAIAHNTALIKKLVAPAKLMCVVKANAYNHGAKEVAAVMSAAGADAFGVATISEALDLRAAGISQPILAWIWQPSEDVARAVEAGIDLAIITLEHARALARLGTPLSTYIKVDTGMNRSGLLLEDLPELFTLLHTNQQIQVRGMMSHFARADEPDHPMTDEQLARFDEAIEAGRAAGFELAENHIANSPGVFLGEKTRYEMVRPGVALYGQEPIAGRSHGLKPAMTWVGQVTVVKRISAGDTVSYGGTWAASKGGFVAVIPAGYADGVPRAAQGCIEVTIGGRKYPQVGRVCMDQIIVDLGANEAGVRQGDEAVIFGEGGISAAQFAEKMGTIHYEVICRPTGRTRRVYVGERATQEIGKHAEQDAAR